MLRKNSLIILISILILVFIVSLAACCRPKQDIFIVKEVGDELIIMGMSEKYKTIEELNFPITIYHNKKDRKIIGIGEGAFKEYKNLKKVYLPDDIKTIEKEAFSGCKKLESINLPIGLLEIGDKAFSNTGLKRVNLEKRDINIQNDAFAFSEKLVLYTGCREINKPNSWSEFAFRDVNVYWNFIISKTENAAAVHVEPEQSEYTAYSEITLDFSQVDSMWLHDAFSNNEKITINDTTNKARIVIQSDIIINLQAKEITVTDSLQYEKNFEGTGYIVKGFRPESKPYILANKEKYQTLSFPNEYTQNGETLPVVEIAASAFDSVDIEIVNILIHGGIKSIGARAFYNLSYLENVKIEEGVRTIGNSCFELDRAIKEIEFSSSIDSIGEWAFSKCSSITKIDLNETNVKVINSNTFDENTALMSLYLPKNTLTLKTTAILNCSNLEELFLPNSIVTIEMSAITYCDSLKKINIPSSYIPQKGETLLGWDSYFPIFSYCKNLATIEGMSTANYTISNNALVVGKSLLNLGVNSSFPVEIEEICPASVAYNKTSNLALPSSVNKIGFGAFLGFSGATLDLSQVTIAEIPDAFIGSVEGKEIVNGVGTIILPSTVTSIGSEAFGRCRNLKAIKFSMEEGDGFSIPSTITHIDGYAFSGCDLLKINTNRKKTEKPIGWDEDCFTGVLEKKITWLS